MSARGISPEVKESVLAAAPGTFYISEIARKLGRPESTVKGWVRYFDIADEVKRVQRGLEGPQESARMGPLEFSDRPDIVGATGTVEPDVERIRKHAEERFAAKAKRAEQKKHQRVRFDHGPVALFYVGDEHLGNAGTDVARVFDEQAQIMATPGSYVVATGDSVDNMIIGKLLADRMKPGLSVWESWELARHYFAGYKNRMLAHIGGNHNGWTLKLSGIDYSRDITPNGVLYDSDEIRMTVHVGHHEFRIRSRHKYPGNSIYNPTHGLERAARFDTPDFDVFTGAHVHKGAMAREFNLNGRRKIALLSGTFKTEDDYGREVGFSGNDGSTACGLVLEDDGAFWASASVGAIQKYMKATYRGS